MRPKNAFGLGKTLKPLKNVHFGLSMDEECLGTRLRWQGEKNRGLKKLAPIVS